MSEPPTPPLCQEACLLKQRGMTAKPAQSCSLGASQPCRKEPLLLFSPMASVDKETGKPQHGAVAWELTELMKASPLGSISMSSEPVSAKQS